MIAAKLTECRMRGIDDVYLMIELNVDGTTSIIERTFRTPPDTATVIADIIAEKQRILSLQEFVAKAQPLVQGEVDLIAWAQAGGGGQ